MPLIKVTDPLKVVTDTLLISQLEKQGIYADEVQFTQDYAMPVYKDGEREKGKSPYAKFYKHLNSRSQFMVSSGLPMCDYKGQLLDVGFIPDSGGYRSKTNVFDSFVTLDGQVTAGCLNDQPDGRKSGQISRWSPVLYLGKKEIKPSKPKLLEIDPINESYKLNVLEWDYGICKRRIRLIEGRTLGTWEFPTNPNGDVRIVYNQSGDFLVKLGMYAVNPNEERIPLDVFNQAQYPFTVGDSQTFYPDADAETSSVDGYVFHVQSLTWANLIAAAGNQVSDNAGTGIGYLFRILADATQWGGLYRSIYLFDTSGLDDAATISGAVLSIRGQAKADNISITPDVDIYSSNPASNTGLAAGDFDSLGSTAFSTAITYAGFSTSAYNDFTLNASGLAAITVSGVSKFGARNANYDVAANTPAHTPNVYSGMNSYFAEKGTGYKPKLVVTYTIPQTYDETGRTQVVNAVVGHSNNQIMTESREQVILAAQGGNAVRHYYETALEQVILAAAGKSDLQTMVEARGQAIPVIIGKTDLQTMIESRGQVVLVAQGHTDLAILNELSKTQVILAVLGETEGLKYTEALGQVVLAVVGETDLATFLEAREQVIKAAIGESDNSIYSEIAGQVISAIIGESDFSTFLESHGQVITVTVSEADNMVYIETAQGQVAIAEIGEADNVTFLENALQLINAQIGKSDNHIMTENQGQVILVVQGESDVLNYIINIPIYLKLRAKDAYLSLHSKTVNLLLYSKTKSLSLNDKIINLKIRSKNINLQGK